MTAPDGFRPIGPVDAFPVGEPTVVEADGDPVAVVRTDDGVFAISPVCPHAGGPLGDGTLSGTVLRCPWHGYQFDVATGENPQGSPLEATTYPVRVEAGEVWVAV